VLNQNFLQRMTIVYDNIAAAEMGLGKMPPVIPAKNLNMIGITFVMNLSLMNQSSMFHVITPKVHSIEYKHTLMCNYQARQNAVIFQSNRNTGD